MNKYLDKRLVEVASVLLILIFIGLPFNGLPYEISFFGEMTLEGSFYVIILSIPVYLILMGIYKKRVSIPWNYPFLLFGTFLVWILISGLFNYNEIFINIFKERTGISKFIGQVIIICFSFFNLIFLYNLMKLVGLKRIKVAFQYSLILPFVYSFFEILHGLNLEFATSMLLSIEKYLHIYGIWSYLLGEEFRIRSVSGEASWFATYLVFILPWLLNYAIFSKKHIYKLLLFYSLILTYFTYSRTVYVIVLIQLMIFFYFLLINSKKFDYRVIFNQLTSFIKEKKRIAYSILSVLIIILGSLGYKSFQIISSLFDNDNLSNVARLSSQIAAVKMGFDNFIFGVGLGQYGFYMPEYVSKEALIKSQEIAQWATNLVGTPWPPVHGLYARIFAETGFVGLVIWLTIWGTLIYTGIQVLRSYKGNETNNIASVLTMIFGILFVGFNIDTFRVIIYYAVLAMSFVYFEEYGCREPLKIFQLRSLISRKIKKQRDN